MKILEDINSVSAEEEFLPPDSRGDLQLWNSFVDDLYDKANQLVKTIEDRFGKKVVFQEATFDGKTIRVNFNLTQPEEIDGKAD